MEKRFIFLKCNDAMDRILVPVKTSVCIGAHINLWVLSTEIGVH